MERLERVWVGIGAVIWWMARMLAYISAAALFATMLILLRESIGRYFFDAPTTYSYPLMQVALVLIVYLGLAYTAASDGHVSSDVLYERLPLRGQEVVHVVSNVGAIYLGYLLTSYAVEMAQKSSQIDARIAGLGSLPLAGVQSMIAVGSVALMLVCISKIPYHVGNTVRGERAPFPPPSWKGKYDFSEDSDLPDMRA